MEKIGFINERIMENAALINEGRPLMYTKGKEVQGLAFFMVGISSALQAFREAQTSQDPKTMIQAEQVFVRQELHFNRNRSELSSSLKPAIISLDEALLSLSVVEIQEEYRIANKTYGGKGRIGDLPNDVFRMTCNSHAARLKNNLKTSALGDTEIELIKQRLANLKTAENQYIEKQRIALGLPGKTKIQTKSKKKKQ